MLRLQRTYTHPIGLDLGAESVKLIQVQAAGDSLEIVAAARHVVVPSDESSPHDPVAARAEALKAASRLLGTGGFRGRRVVAALPREIVHFKNIRLPMIPAEELAGAVEIEARNIFPFDTDDAHVRHLYAGEVRQGGDARQEVIVLAARNQDVDRYVEELAESGMEIESLDFEPAAIFRCLERFVRRRGDEQGVQVVLDVGLRRSQLIIGRGRDITFYKGIDIGGQHLNEAVARKLSLSLDEARSLRHRLADATSRIEPTADPAPHDATAPTPDQPTGPEAKADAQHDPVWRAVADADRSIIEDLAQEVMLCLRYHSVTFRGHRPAQIQLMGGEAGDPYVCEILSASLGMPVAPGWPMRNIETSRMPPGERRGALSGWAAALGLALRRVASRGVSQNAPARRPAPTLAAGSAEVVDLPSHNSSSTAAPAPSTSRAPLAQPSWRPTDPEQPRDASNAPSAPHATPPEQREKAYAA
jgi:type IV pilus assembly protein PilM